MGSTCGDLTTFGTRSQDLVSRMTMAVTEVKVRGGDLFANELINMAQSIEGLPLEARCELVLNACATWLEESTFAAHYEAATSATGNSRTLGRMALGWLTARTARRRSCTPVRRLVARARRAIRQVGAAVKRCRAPRTQRHTNVAVQHSSGGGGGPGEGDPDQPDAPAPNCSAAPVAPPTSSPTTEDTPLRHLARGLLDHVLKGGAGR